ncbi:MAG: hypothetical protein SGILL_004672 [Bacillariaceae sp.]
MVRRRNLSSTNTTVMNRLLLLILFLNCRLWSCSSAARPVRGGRGLQADSQQQEEVQDVLEELFPSVFEDDENSTTVVENDFNSTSVPESDSVVEVEDGVVPAPLPPLPTGNITVGAFYYPWHGEDFHNGEGFLRAELDPRQAPELGEYDDTKKKTIQKHLEYSDVGNIDLWVTSWWGPDRISDETTQDSIMKQVEREEHPLRIALLYESTNRLKVDGEWKLDEDRIADDMKHISKEYFEHFDNYYTIDGKPVIIMYLTRVLQMQGGSHEDGETLLQEAVALMREKAKTDIYIIGDHAFDPYPVDVSSEQAAIHNSSLQVLDAIINCECFRACTVLLVD